MAGIIGSLSINQQLELIYIGYFGRAADPGGFTFWTNQDSEAQAGGQSAALALTNIANSFTPQPETIALYPFLANSSSLVGTTNPALLAGLQNLVNQIFENEFGHAATDNGFWAGQVVNGDVGVGALALAIANGATGADATTITNKITVGLDFTTRTGGAGLGETSPLSPGYLSEAKLVVGVTTSDPASIPTAEALTTQFIATAAVPTFTLTPGVDADTASAALTVFNALPGSNPPLGVTNTLNAGDNLQDSFGDGILNYTAVSNLLANPPLATGVTMNGISTANILNSSTGLAGFSGNITGLTAATLMSGSINGVLLGTATNGLNTALASATISASESFTAWMTAAALGGAPSATVHLTGVTTHVTLDVTTGTNGYGSLSVDSGGSGANVLVLDTNATDTATITATGAEALTLSGTALNIANLHTFTGTAATGDLSVSFNGTGHVAATGGGGNDTFTFLTTPGGAATFTSASSVDGGAGTNELVIQADTGAILAAGDGPNITNIQTIENTTNGVATGDLTADLALMGSATMFDLQGAYGGHNVSVTDIIAQTVEYSGSGLANLTLAHTTPLGFLAQINFEMNSSGTGALTLGQLTVGAGLASFNVDSTGSASDNVITNVATVLDNVTITGGTHLTFGSLADPYSFVGGTIDASADTGGVTTWLADLGTPNLPKPTQTFIGGTGGDTVHLLNFAGDVIDFTKGGSDIIDFHVARFTGDGLLTNAPPSLQLYNSVLGFTQANDTVDITNSAALTAFGAVAFTNDGAVPAGAATNILQYTGSGVVNAQTLPDNWIKIVHPTSGAGETAATGLAAALGTGTINVAASHSFVVSYYDLTDQEAVFETIHTAGTSITAATATAANVNVLGLVHMSQTDYAALTAGNLHFV
jgi:hypothetical protein